MTSSPPPAPTEPVGIVVVDHGSRREESNAALERFVAGFAARDERAVVEPAHMELAEPSIARAYARCVERGARTVVVAPFFLFPGRHWDRDIPQLSAAAAAAHPGTRFLVAGPIGSHPLMAEVLAARLDQCLVHAAGGPACELCDGTDRCRFTDAPDEARP